MTSQQRRVVRVDGDQAAETDDLVADEAPLEIRLQGVPLAVVMRTPGADADLARGFALTEGIVMSPAEIAGVEELGGGDRLELRLSEGVVVDPERFRRSAYVSSSCGVCGKASIDAVRIAGRRPPPGPMVGPDYPGRLVAALREAQPGFDLTGGLHGAALLDGEGRMIHAAEDIGRHNAVDKVIGRVAAGRWPLGEIALVVSGRVSFEITQKAAVVGIPFVAGVSAPSALAVDLATELGLTLVAFVRHSRYVIYSHGHRLRFR